MTNRSVEYKIVDVCYMEGDAYLEICGQRIYFQFSELEEPTIEDALKFIASEMKT